MDAFIETNMRLTNTLRDLSRFENDKLLLWATIYTRQCELLLERKVNDFRNYLNGQVIYYKRSLIKYQDDIDEFVNEYKEKISRVIKQYNEYYIYLQNEVILAQSNQKIAIANLVSTKRNLNKANDEQNVVLAEKNNRKIYASAQKKLNYDVVIDEIMTRLENCMNDTYDVINSIFVYEKSEMLSTKNAKLTILEKLKEIFNINFGGDRNFERSFINPLKENFKNMEIKTISKISDVKTEMLVFISQIEKIRTDINLAFNETLNKVQKNLNN